MCYLFIESVDLLQLVVRHGLGHLVADVVHSGLEIFVQTHLSSFLDLFQRASQARSHLESYE